MEKLTKCMVCEGKGYIEVVAIVGEDNDSVECMACEAGGVVTVSPF